MFGIKYLPETVVSGVKTGTIAVPDAVHVPVTYFGDRAVRNKACRKKGRVKGVSIHLFQQLTFTPTRGFIGTLILHLKCTSVTYDLYWLHVTSENTETKTRLAREDLHKTTDDRGAAFFTILVKLVFTQPFSVFYCIVICRCYSRCLSGFFYVAGLLTEASLNYA